MKALAIRQPYAWLIANGYKDIENRSWNTKYRGPFLIHASQTQVDQQDGVWWYCKDNGIVLPEYVYFGGIVGVATLVDVVTDHPSPWFVGPYGYVLEDARPLPWREFKGRLKFFEHLLILH
mgnify:CR=1 FL=1